MMNPEKKEKLLMWLAGNQAYREFLEDLIERLDKISTLPAPFDKLEEKFRARLDAIKIIEDELITPLGTIGNSEKGRPTKKEESFK